MITEKISFIGGGRITKAVISGLIANGYPCSQIWVNDLQSEKLTKLRKLFNINTTQDNDQIIETADIVIFSVSPQALQSVIKNLNPKLQKNRPLIVSLAAGIELKTLQRWLADTLPIIRCMPNVPSAVISGVTGLLASKEVTEVQKNSVESIFRSVGTTLWFDDEKELAIVTTISSCGPAYFFLVIEAIQDAAVKMGLSAEKARMLTLQTAFGASKMALKSDITVKELRNQVTSPNGITEAAIKHLESRGIKDLFLNAIQEAKIRCETLTKVLTQDEEDSL